MYKCHILLKIGMVRGKVVERERGESEIGGEGHFGQETHKVLFTLSIVAFYL